MRALALAAGLFLLGVSAGYGSPPTGFVTGRIDSISCAATGECAAGGYFHDGGRKGAFLVDEVSGSWRRAITVEGTARLGRAIGARVLSISCVSVGNCTSGGYFSYRARRFQFRARPFIATETNGSWGTAMAVPGMGNLNTGRHAQVASVSCATAGECAAGGQYYDRAGNWHAFLVSKTNGRWHHAITIPGITALGRRAAASVLSVSCGAVGDCAAGGFYGRFEPSGCWCLQALMVNETHGRWSKAIEAPGTAKLNRGGRAVVHSISCPAAGECAAGGVYIDGHGDGYQQAFVVDETNGSWGKAIEVPGTSELNTGYKYGGNAEVTSVSCSAPGECAAAGFYRDGSGRTQVFVSDETNGVWGTAIEVPGSSALNTGGEAVPNSIACAATGECAAGGRYTDGHGDQQAFVVSETNGVWGDAIEVPGTAALNTRGVASVRSISCPADGECGAGGYYDGASGPTAFVVSETGGTWGDASSIHR